jgi:hypothetical protein
LIRLEHSSLIGFLIAEEEFDQLADVALLARIRDQRVHAVPDLSRNRRVVTDRQKNQYA